MSKGKAALIEVYGEESWGRYDALMKRVKLDLAQRGMTNADLAGLDVEDTWEAGAVASWTVSVMLSGGRAPLVYTCANEEGASVHHAGAPLADVVMQ